MVDGRHALSRGSPPDGHVGVVGRRWWRTSPRCSAAHAPVRRARWAASLCLVTAVVAFVAELVSPDIGTISALAVLPILVAGALPSRRSAVGIVGIAVALRGGAVVAGRLGLLPALIESGSYVVIGLIVPALLPEWSRAPVGMRHRHTGTAPAPRRRRTDLPGFGGQPLPLPVARLHERIDEAMQAASRPARDGAGAPACLLRALGCAQLTAGRLVQAERSLRRSVEIDTAEGDADGLSAGTAGLALALALGGALAEADRLLLEAAVAAQLPSTAALEAGALVHWLGGRAPAAVSCAVEASTLSGGTPSEGRVWVMSVAAVAAAETGRIEEAGWYRAQAAAVAAACGVPTHHVDWADGIIAWRSGTNDLGLRCLTVAAEGLAREGMIAPEAFVLAHVAGAAAHAGRLPAARAAADRLAKIAETAGGALFAGLSGTAAAWSNLAAGTVEAAADAARTAEQLLDGAGYRRLALDARHALGSAARDGDRAAATDLLRETAAAYSALGDRWRAERVTSSLRRVRASAHPAPTGLAALTRRERQVVDLAARGVTAREIGEQLFIGERTVETHLANAYGKLGVHSRLELIQVLGDSAA